MTSFSSSNSFSSSFHSQSDPDLLENLNSKLNLFPLENTKLTSNPVKFKSLKYKNINLFYYLLIIFNFFTLFVSSKLWIFIGIGFLYKIDDFNKDNTNDTIKYNYINLNNFRIESGESFYENINYDICYISIILTELIISFLSLFMNRENEFYSKIGNEIFEFYFSFRRAIGLNIVFFLLNVFQIILLNFLKEVFYEKESTFFVFLLLYLIFVVRFLFTVMYGSFLIYSFYSRKEDDILKLLFTAVYFKGITFKSGNFGIFTNQITHKEIKTMKFMFIVYNETRRVLRKKYSNLESRKIDKLINYFPKREKAYFFVFEFKKKLFKFEIYFDERNEMIKVEIELQKILNETNKNGVICLFWYEEYDREYELIFERTDRIYNYIYENKENSVKRNLNKTNHKKIIKEINKIIRK